RRGRGTGDHRRFPARPLGPAAPARGPYGTEARQGSLNPGWSRQTGIAMPTTRETILAALHARLSALPATALRGEMLPERVPAEGLLILRDGEPGEPEVTLSPLRYHYQHRAEIEAVVQGAS